MKAATQVSTALNGLDRAAGFSGRRSTPLGSAVRTLDRVVRTERG